MDQCFHNGQQYACVVPIAETPWWMYAVAVFTIVAVIIGLLMWLMPIYNVWASRLAGQADLAQAEAESKVRVRNAHAEEEAAHHLAAAEVIRAEGVAKAIDIIGKGLHENENYLKYLWVENMNNQEAKIIYVPTEAGLPILEAGRMK